MLKRIALDDLPEQGAATFDVTDEELQAAAGGYAAETASEMAQPSTCHISGCVDCD